MTVNGLMTRHANERCAQRAIPPFVVGLLLDYGKVAYRHGAEVFFFDKRSRKQLKRELGSRLYNRLEDQLNVYVVANDQVITAGHRTQRMRR